MRSKWKLPFFSNAIAKLAFSPVAKQHSAKQTLKVYSRSSLIPEVLLGQRVLVHNGMSLVSVLLREYHYGYKFGDLVPTKRFGFGIHVEKTGKGKKKK